ncbi:uncharacterized protein LOC128236725 [Mya arenaria]|uniref:uncharacterized protein LOC128236725 n=1 Tax=Mya arenaria TaxID=6604 RepID=UPI0022E0A0E4|nr:uncharacterized protein LOC128236725 [Mya arenaria]
MRMGNMLCRLRYPEGLNGGRFKRFPTYNPILRSTNAGLKPVDTGRPHEKLNVNRINKHEDVCSKHFHEGNGPSKEYPDPLSADGWRITSSRKLPTKRSLGKETYGSIYTQNASRKAGPGSCRHCTRSRNTDRMSMDVTFGYVCTYRSECFPKRTVVTKRSPS